MWPLVTYSNEDMYLIIRCVNCCVGVNTVLYGCSWGSNLHGFR